MVDRLLFESSRPEYKVLLNLGPDVRRTMCLLKTKHLTFVLIPFYSKPVTESDELESIHSTKNLSQVSFTDPNSK